MCLGLLRIAGLLPSGPWSVLVPSAVPGSESSVSVCQTEVIRQCCPQDVAWGLPGKDSKCEALGFCCARATRNSQVMLSDPRVPPLVQGYPWIRTSSGPGQRLHKRRVLPTRRCAAWGPACAAPAHNCFCFQAVFTLLLGPFTFFDVQKTKYLQILTSLMRWIGESGEHHEPLRFLPRQLCGGGIVGSPPALLPVGTFSTENVASLQGHIEWTGLELIQGPAFFTQSCWVPTNPQTGH